MPEGEHPGQHGCGPRTRNGATAETTVDVVLERRDSSHPWQDEVWRVLAVQPSTGTGEETSTGPDRECANGWRTIESGPGFERYHAGSMILALYAGETEGYAHNLQAQTPKVFVVLRPRDETRDDDTRDDETRDSDAEPAVEPFLVTACAFEAQDYMDSGEQPVEAVPMPADLQAWVRSFVDRHHVVKPLKKRRKRSASNDGADDLFARRPAGKRPETSHGYPGGGIPGGRDGGRGGR